jgi:hypothetical protein
MKIAHIKLASKTTGLNSTIKIMSKCGFNLRLASEEQRNNKDIVLAAVRNVGWAMEYASTGLKSDQLFFLNVLRTPMMHSAFRFFNQALRFDRDNAILAVSVCGPNLQFTSPQWQDDNEIAQIALGSSFISLNYLPERFKDDEAIMLAAVNDNSYFLNRASKRLRNDEELVIAAVKTSGKMLKWASADLKANKKVAEIAIKEDGLALEFVSEDLKADKEFVLLAVDVNGDAVKFASATLQDDNDVALAAFAKCRSAYTFLSPRLKYHGLVDYISGLNFAKWNFDFFLLAKRCSPQVDRFSRPVPSNASCAISSECVITLLNFCDNEVMRSIGTFLGVPFGHQRKRLKCLNKTHSASERL